MDRVRGVGRGYDIAGADDGEQQMGERIFGAHGDDRFFFGVEIDVVVALVAGADLLAKFRNAARQRIAMIARIAGGFAELVDDYFRGLAIGVTHAEIDHVHLGCPCLCAHLVENGKDIRGSFWMR